MMGRLSTQTTFTFKRAKIWEIESHRVDFHTVGSLVGYLWIDALAGSTMNIYKKENPI